MRAIFAFEIFVGQLQVMKWPHYSVPTQPQALSTHSSVVRARKPKHNDTFCVDAVLGFLFISPVSPTLEWNMPLTVEIWRLLQIYIFFFRYSATAFNFSSASFSGCYFIHSVAHFCMMQIRLIDRCHVRFLSISHGKSFHLSAGFLSQSFWYLFFSLFTYICFPFHQMHETIAGCVLMLTSFRRSNLHLEVQVS